MEGDVLDAEFLRALDVGLGSEAAVEAGLSGRFAERCDVPLEESLDQSGVGWVTCLDHAVEDERGGASQERDLVAVADVAAALHDDVGVRLEDRDDLLAGGHGLAAEHAPPRLVEHAIHEGKHLAQSLQGALQLR
jgi:hypothetical protein